MSAQDSPRRRKSTPATPPKLIRTSVPLDVETHARLCGLAALKSVDRSTLAARFIKAAVGGVVLFDKRGNSDLSEDDDRQTARGEERDSGEDAAA